MISLNIYSGNPKQPGQSEPESAKVELTESDRRLFDYYFYEAMNAKAIGESDSSYDFLMYCYQMDSTNANVLFELGSYNELLRNLDEALHFYKKATSYVQNNFYYDIALATLCLEMQQFGEAVDLFRALVDQNPEKIDLYLYLSEAYRLSEDIPNAIKTLNDLEKIVGLNERISFQKFQLYTAIDKKKEAYAEMQKYVDMYPDEAKYPIFLGNLYMFDNQPKEALAAYEKARTIDPDNPVLTLAMANYYEQTGDKQAAEKELKSALFNKEIDVDTKIEILAQYIGSLEQRKQSTKGINTVLDSLMLQYPQEARLNLMYGNLLMLQEKKDSAYFQFQIYTESIPTDPVGWEQLLRTVFPDSINKSIEVCQQAISYIPDYPIFYFYLGIGNYLNDDYRTAIDVMKKGINVVDKDKQAFLLSEFYGQLGDIYHQSGNQDSSFVYYEEALKYNPRNLGVLNNYSYHLSLEKRDLDKAEKMSSIIIKAEPTNPTYLDTYGWVLFVQGAYTIAKTYIENAVKYSEEKGTPSAEIYEHYGDILYKTGNPDKALEYWEKAKETSEKENKILDKKIKTKTFVEE